MQSERAREAAEADAEAEVHNGEKLDVILSHLDALSKRMDGYDSKAGSGKEPDNGPVTTSPEFDIEKEKGDVRLGARALQNRDRLGSCDRRFRSRSHSKPCRPRIERLGEGRAPSLAGRGCRSLSPARSARAAST